MPDFDESSRRGFLIGAGLNSDQITRFEGALREITQHAVDNFSSALQIYAIKLKKYGIIVGQIEAKFEVTQIEQLFNSCIDCGTLPLQYLRVMRSLQHPF